MSDRLTDRLQGRYAMGPHMPNGDPEFGWRQFESPPIQHEAAQEIKRLRRQIELFWNGTISEHELHESRFQEMDADEFHRLRAEKGTAYD